LRVVSVRTDDRYRFQCLLQWQKVTCILQKYYAFAGSIQREFLMLGRVHHLPGVREINVWVLEKPELEFQLQHSSHSAIDQLHGNSPVIYVFNQRRHVGGLVGNIQVDASFEGENACFLLRWNNALVNECAKSLAFTHHDSLKTELVS